MKSALFQGIFIFREEVSIPIFSYFTQYSQYILTGIVSKNTKCWFCRKWDTIGKFGIHFWTKISLFLLLMSQSADYLVLLVCKFIFLASRYIQFYKNWNLAQKSYSCWPFSVKMIQNGVFFINNGKICWNTPPISHKWRLSFFQTIFHKIFETFSVFVQYNSKPQVNGNWFNRLQSHPLQL